ncbi:MAG: hypothetical protein ACHQ4H_14225 [Ktedonobacterales bacterium]
MSGPGGSVTKRDQRRDSRREQYEAARRQRQLEVQRKLRAKRIQRIAVYASAALVVVLLGALLIHAVIGGGSSAGANTVIHGKGTYTQPAFGETRDSMPCLPSEGAALHTHTYLEIYANGQPYQVPADTGIVAASSCLYPLHVHEGATNQNIIHVESNIQATYTLGAFFDIWGQQLSATQALGFKADATHPLVFEVFDANGKLTKWTGNPLDIPLNAHNTVVILYNSPNVTPQAYTNWSGL